MIFDFILSGMSVAGIAVIWRNWLEDHSNWNIWIKKYLGKGHKILTCGSCFTYWLALTLTLTTKPLGLWLPFGVEFNILNAALQWMALSWLGVFLRFSYVALQELVAYQVHTLKNHIHK
ncbi:MAG: hypothetical protein RJA61_733 [Candidatus Parcubacteria bacterium]|jgi:hypothetical protein